MLVEFALTALVAGALVLAGVWIGHRVKPREKCRYQPPPPCPHQKPDSEPSSLPFRRE